MDKKNEPAPDVAREGAPPAPRRLTPEAERALAEAIERRAAAERADVRRAAEVGGPSGPEPTRYGAWEKGGIASDY
jgi:hypothetical protein